MGKKAHGGKPTRSRLARVGTHHSNAGNDNSKQGILNYFDVNHKGKPASVGKVGTNSERMANNENDSGNIKDIVVVLDGDEDEEVMNKEVDQNAPGRAIVCDGLTTSVEQVRPGPGHQHGGKETGGVSHDYESILLAEEYGGHCLSQDILLGDAGGKVAWNASPCGGMLGEGRRSSIEQALHFATMSPDGTKRCIEPHIDNKDTLSIEPIVLPRQRSSVDAGSAEKGVDDVLDELSSVLKHSKRRRKSISEDTNIEIAKEEGGAEKKQGDGANKIGALMNLCSTLQSKLSAISKRVHVEKAPNQDESVKKVTISESVIKNEVESVVGAKVSSWEDDSDEDDMLLTALDAVEAKIDPQKINSSMSSGVQEQHVMDKEVQTRVPLRHRYEVISCGPDSSDGGYGIVLVLRQVHSPKSSTMFAHLTSPWDDGDYRAGDPVNLVNVKEYMIGEERHCRVGIGQPGFLIHYPDMLLGGTRVTSSCDCRRRAYLSERMTGEGSAMAAAVKGTMYHQMIQQALLLQYRRSSQLKEIIKDIVASMPEQLLDSELTADEATAWLNESIPATLSFLNRFVRKEPAACNSCTVVGNGCGDEQINSCITDVADVEEYFVSPTYGLKGFVDSTISLKSAISQRNGAFKMSDPILLDSLAPLEVKTGRPRHTDAAQVLLYLLALEERYGSEVPRGMLFYKNEMMPSIVKRDDNQLAALLANRNCVAASLARSELPPMTPMKGSCTNCFERSSCALIHASKFRGTSAEFLEGLPEQSSTYSKLKHAYDMETSHLSENDKSFLSKWDSLLDIEGDAASSKRHEIWTMSGSERERLGRCISTLSLVEVADAEWVSKGHNGFNRKGRLYSFAKPNNGRIVGNVMAYGEPVLLSIEGGPVGVSRGHIQSIDSQRVIVHTDRPIRKKVVHFSTLPEDQGKNIVDLNLVWRLDKEEVMTTVPRTRAFLFDLFNNVENPHMNQRRKRLRDLIVDLENRSDASNLSPQEKNAVDVQASELRLNEEQKRAVEACLVQKDYSLVLGVPGAGKTTAVVAMIKALEMSGKRVLLVSYTNSAVDHVMIKLASQGFENFIRIGRRGRVNKNLEEFLPSGSRYNAETPEELSAVMSKVPVVGVSALGITDSLLRKCDFDVCIVDEAGQITLPAILGPIMRAQRFVLVGDHHQLPPLVASPEAEERGFGEPLFARLADAHPEAVITLSRQYRMSEEIQSISNKFIYGGALCCGSPEVAQARLDINMQSLSQGSNWLIQALMPSNPVAFIDTRISPNYKEICRGDVVENHGEASLALTIVQSALTAGLQDDSIAVISPYRSQVSLLNEKFKTESLSVDCLTIDKAQGRDKDMVIVSLVRSNEGKTPGKLLQDSRRVNVAFTRAKSKLIILGDSETLRNIQLFDNMIQYFNSMGWVHPVDW